MNALADKVVPGVCLDEYNSDLNFVIEADGVTGSSLSKNGFEYIWAGARATRGVSSGKACYEVLVQEKLQVEMPNTETYPHVMRVGWSVDASPFSLGEAPLSYGYGGTGKSSFNNNFLHYGKPYSTDDVITCYIDLDAVPKTIFFAKNGNYLGEAFRLGPEAEGKVLYPHISVKNMRFAANFGGFNPYFPAVQGFSFLQHLPPQMLNMPPASPKDRWECEALMMVGLPSSGKTTWLEKYVKDHPEKKYNVLGTNDILVKMKVMGLGRKRNYHGRWDALIKQASGILNEMLKVVKHKNRNYILDQTNVYPNARRRKMNSFNGYHRIAVVVVNENSVLMQRNAKVVRKDGKIVPESAFMEMKANFTLPVQGEIFNEVWYVEENEERSQYLVGEFNREGKCWKEGQTKRPVDEQAKEESETQDFKKPKYADSTNSNQRRNQHGTQNYGPGGRHRDNTSGGESTLGSQHNYGSHPQRFNQGGKPTVPCQESNPVDARERENCYPQPNQNAYPQRQPQHNPQSRGTIYGQPGSTYNNPQETGSHSQEGFHLPQPKNYNPGYHQGGQGGGGFPRRNPGINYNQPANPQGSRDEGGPHQGQPGNYNPGYHQAGQGEGGVPRGNPGDNYNQPANPQGRRDEGVSHQGQLGNYNHHQAGQGEGGFPRGNTGNHYNQPVKLPNYSGSAQGYDIKQESWHSRQGVDQNPNEGYYGRTQLGDYDSTLNYTASSYPGNSQSWSSSQQGGFNQPQGYWGDKQGSSSAQGQYGFQGYEKSQPNVPQATRQDNWNHNQPHYRQGQPQNYQY